MVLVGSSMTVHLEGRWLSQNLLIGPKSMGLCIASASQGRAGGMPPALSDNHTSDRCADAPTPASKTRATATKKICQLFNAAGWSRY